MDQVSRGDPRTFGRALRKGQCTSNAFLPDQASLLWGAQKVSCTGQMYFIFLFGDFLLSVSHCKNEHIFPSPRRNLETPSTLILSSRNPSKSFKITFSVYRPSVNVTSTPPPRGEGKREADGKSPCAFLIPGGLRILPYTSLTLPATPSPSAPPPVRLWGARRDSGRGLSCRRVATRGVSSEAANTDLPSETSSGAVCSGWSEKRKQSVEGGLERRLPPENSLVSHRNLPRQRRGH